MSVFVSWTEFVHDCSLCHRRTIEGGFLIGGITGPWSYWVCIECDDYLDEIERKNYNLEEGTKINGQ